MTSTQLRVTDPSGPGEVRRVATALAEQLGLDETLRGRVAIVATEIATNVQRHGGGGSVFLRAADDVTGKYVEILAVDKGPGISDIEGALRDGFSTGGSAGTGLGAIARMAADFDVWSSNDQGTAVIARLGDVARVPFQLGVVSTPAPGETVCGDSYFVHSDGANLRIAVVDGLGHGRMAAEAADAAIDVFKRTTRRSLVDIIDEAHGALRATRGAAVGVLDLDLISRAADFAGIGNISGTIIDRAGTRKSVVSHNGIVGHTVRKVQPFHYEWPADSAVILFSDGMTTSWNTSVYRGIHARHPALLAGLIARDHTRGRDDATVVVLHDRPARSP
jgi:anti-sigma regulatory factor (Ser/Thr protein kinase)